LLYTGGGSPSSRLLGALYLPWALAAGLAFSTRRLPKVNALAAFIYVALSVVASIFVRSRLPGVSSSPLITSIAGSVLLVLAFIWRPHAPAVLDTANLSAKGRLYDGDVNINGNAYLFPAAICSLGGACLLAIATVTLCISINSPSAWQIGELFIPWAAVVGLGLATRRWAKARILAASTYTGLSVVISIVLRSGFPHVLLAPLIISIMGSLLLVLAQIWQPVLSSVDAANRTDGRSSGGAGSR
jgi:hypothetical protein